MSSPRLLSYFLWDLIPILLLISGLLVFACCVLKYTLNPSNEEYKVLLIKAIKEYYSRVWKKKSKNITLPECLKEERDINSSTYAVYIFALCASISYVLTVMWDAFLITRQRDNCVEGLHCYIFDGQPNVLLQRPLNCTNFDQENFDSESFSIFCYKYAYNFTGVLTDAGGSMAFIGIEFLIVARVFRFFFEEKTEEEKKSNSDKKKKSKDVESTMNTGNNHKSIKTICPKVFFMLTVSFGAIIFIYLPTILFSSLKVYLFSDVTKVIQHIILVAHILLASLIPWCHI